MIEHGKEREGSATPLNLEEKPFALGQKSARKDSKGE